MKNKNFRAFFISTIQTVMLICSCSNSFVDPYVVKTINPNYMINSIYEPILKEYFETHQSEIKEEIELRGYKDKKIRQQEMKIAYSFGSYNDAYIFTPFYREFHETSWNEPVYCINEIDENHRLISRGKPLVVYKDHVFYSVKEAFDNNVLDIEKNYPIIYQITRDFCNMAVSNQQINYENYASWRLDLNQDKYNDNDAYRLLSQKYTDVNFVRYLGSNYDGYVEYGDFIEPNVINGIFPYYDIAYDIMSFNIPSLENETHLINGQKIDVNEDEHIYVYVHDLHNNNEAIIPLEEAYNLNYINDIYLQEINNLVKFDKDSAIGNWKKLDIYKYMKQFDNNPLK